MRHSFSLVCTAQCSPGFHWIHLWVLLFRHWHPLCYVIVKQPVCVVCRATLLASLVSVQFHWKPSLLYVSHWLSRGCSVTANPLSSCLNHPHPDPDDSLSCIIRHDWTPENGWIYLGRANTIFLKHFYVLMSTLMQLSRELLNCKEKFIFISHNWDSGIN